MNERVPSVSVIVPVRDDPRIAACVRALLDQDYAEPFEVVVVDNGSRTPVSQELADIPSADYPSVHVISHPDGGSYAARNAGVMASSGRVLAFTDADCLPERQWLSRAIAALRETDIVAGRIQVYARDPKRPHPVEAYELVHAFPQERYVQRGGACVCANMVTTRAVFDEAGPFRVVPSGADVEWARRAHAIGHKVQYVPDAVVLHPARQAFGQLSRKLDRVISGKRDIDAARPDAEAARLPGPRKWVPPVGSIKRARQHPDLNTIYGCAALLVGEFWHRYAAAWISTRTALLHRRQSRQKV